MRERAGPSVPVKAHLFVCAPPRLRHTMLPKRPVATPHRYFQNWPSYTQCLPWLGAPVSMLLRRTHASEFRSVLLNASTEGYAIDVAMSSHHLETHFIAQEPQLCHELGEVGGGTSFRDGPPEPGTVGSD